MIKIGQEVIVKNLGLKGKIVYIDYPHLYQDHMYPVQLKLEKEYYSDGYDNALMYRCGLKELDLN